ncbi:MAG TPA: HU family DNA-binding protein, partial [Isosphaeraceae bacterium]
SRCTTPVFFCGFAGGPSISSRKGPERHPGLVKLKVVPKPATKARPGRNPFTGESITIKARPARNVVRALPMKALKELV